MVARTTVTNSLETFVVPQAVSRALHEMRRPIVITHVVPDADAVGAMCAFARAWTSQTCAAKASLPEGSLSQRLTFLFELAAAPVASPADFAAADGFVVFDTARKGRCNVGPALKETDWSAGRPVVNIDHHESNTGFGSLNWVEPGAGSTCELVFALLRRADRPIDAVTATLLYAGLQTDTLGFSLPTTTASALHAAAELVGLGADVTELGERLCRSHRRSEFELLRVVYANTKVAADGQLAYSHAGYEDIHGAGCTAADIDEQINIPRSLDGVRLAILFSEGNRGKTRINFRSSGEVTVVELAERFGGGGHLRAAGAVLGCCLDDAMQRVLPAAIEHLQRFPPRPDDKAQRIQ